MDIFSVFTLFGGLAFFLFGMNTMSGGLEKMAGSKLERTLRQMTSNPLKSMALGAGITIAIQSSSALTVMLVGLVNSGIMTVGQTVGVIMGSNIGTTLTAWLLSLTGIQSANIFIRLLKPESFSPIIAFVGIVLVMLGKSQRKKDTGHIMLGFAVLMYGMQLMSGAVKPLAEVPEFASILTMFQNPILGVVVGAVFTGVIQSSAASVGILQALSLTGGITFNMAIPIIMGQNIGTCVTSLISSIGTNSNAKRVAMVHIYFNLIGTIICMVLYYGLNVFFQFSFGLSAISPFGVALVHSIFNVFTTAILAPFPRQLEKLASFTIRDKADTKSDIYIDERLLLSPAFAISECRSMTAKMAVLAKDTLLLAMDQVKEYNVKQAAVVLENESKLDKFEDILGSFMVKLSSKELSERDSQEISKLLLTIGDFERIGDHAVNILDAAKEMYDKKIHFSKAATAELEVIYSALNEILEYAIGSFNDNDAKRAMHVEPLEQVIDELRTELKMRHIGRLQAGLCTIELGFIFSDLLSNFERVSDHCSNIAVCVIQIKDSSFETHDYLNTLKMNDPEFVAEFRRDKARYSLPPQTFEQEFTHENPAEPQPAK